MPTSAPGSSTQARPVRRQRRPAAGSGFTLIELLVVISIIAIASAGVAFALRDNTGAALDRDAQRLAALLESGRARSRMTGQPVRWVVTEQGFRFEGVQRGALPQRWLDAGTRVVGQPALILGPEPLIPPQALTLTSVEHPERTVRIATDGLRPFTVGGAP